MNREEPKYKIESALYPGSFVHITPSFLFPKVVYVDSFKKAQIFFDNKNIYKFINDNKEYKLESSVTFHKSDYRSDFKEEEQSFDLLLSQYAGFISQACKKYLKIGGLLVTNNSHGDASKITSYSFQLGMKFGQLRDLLSSIFVRGTLCLYTFSLKKIQSY